MLDTSQRSCKRQFRLLSAAEEFRVQNSIAQERLYAERSLGQLEHGVGLLADRAGDCPGGSGRQGAGGVWAAGA